MKKKPSSKAFKVTAADTNDFIVTAKRLLQSLGGMDVVVKPGVAVGIEFHRPKVDINAPGGYGILPFAMSATRQQLVAAIEQLELAKYTLTEQGDYLNAWRSGMRQNILIGVLTGMTTFKLSRL